MSTCSGHQLGGPAAPPVPRRSRAHTRRRRPLDRTAWAETAGCRTAPRTATPESIKGDMVARPDVAHFFDYLVLARVRLRRSWSCCASPACRHRSSITAGSYGTERWAIAGPLRTGSA